VDSLFEMIVPQWQSGVLCGRYRDIGVVEMRSGPYSAGRRADEFLSERLAGGVVVRVSQLLAEAEHEAIDPTTLRRAAKRLSVMRPVCWALLAERSAAQQATVKREDPAAPVEAEGQAVPAVAGTDPRIKQVVAEVSQLITEGMDREIAIHRACRADRELASQVEAVLGKH